MNFHCDDFVAFVTINLQISKYFVTSCILVCSLFPDFLTIVLRPIVRFDDTKKCKNMWHMYEKRNQITKYEMQVHNTVVIPEFFTN